MFCSVVPRKRDIKCIKCHKSYTLHPIWMWIPSKLKVSSLTSQSLFHLKSSVLEKSQNSERKKNVSLSKYLQPALYIWGTHQQITKKNGLCCKWAAESLCSGRSCVLRGSLFWVTHVTSDIQNSLLRKTCCLFALLALPLCYIMYLKWKVPLGDGPAWYYSCLSTFVFCAIWAMLALPFFR